MKKFLLFIVVFPFILNTTAQTNPDHQKIYKLNYKSEIPLTLGMFALNIYGFYLMGQKPTLTLNEVNSLNQNDIWSFDRSVFSQKHPAPSGIYDIADIGLWSSYALPALLFIDKKIRKDWLNISLMYFESQAINLNLYVWGGPLITNRIRPLVYMEEESMDYKLGEETTDSFFSGHVSMVTGATFFMAKVISDYYPELGSKKLLLYGAALIPPAVVAYWRYRGFMHFTSDLLVGAVIGAAVGLSIPQIHKISNKLSKDLTLVPYAGNISGLALSMKF